MSDESATPRARVLVISASIRASGRHDEELVTAAQDHPQEALLDWLRNDAPKRLCNTEALSTVALRAAVDAGAGVDFVSARRLFTVGPRSLLAGGSTVGLDDELLRTDTTIIRQAALDDLLERVAAADAVVMASPVYFGDRSSVADVLMKSLARQDALRGKAFSAVSVGAKRNGGQETTNVYSLFDALNLGAIIHGNSVKTSQYGGTAVGGDRRTVLNDDFGLETTMGTGRRAAQVGELLAALPAQPTTAPRVGFIVTADTADGVIAGRVERLLERVVAKGARADLEVISLRERRIERCLGCDICPYPPMVEGGSKAGTDYACIIDKPTDDMEAIRERLKGLDAFVLVGANLDLPDLVDHYQTFTERTRFIRRGDFEWTNIPFASLVFKDLDASRDRLFGLRVMTSYMRHNMLGIKPARVLDGPSGEPFVDSAVDRLCDLVSEVAALSEARQRVGPVTVGYIAGGSGGYADTRLDGTVAERR